MNFLPTFNTLANIFSKASDNSVVATFALKTSEGNIAHNRSIAASAVTHPGTDATNTATWTVGENVRTLSIGAIDSVGAAIQNDDTFLVVINAPSALMAKSWLEDAGTLGQDVQYEIGFYGQENQFYRDNPITRVDVLPITTITRFIVGGV